MNLDITPIDLLTTAQKKQISEAIFTKVMAAVSKIKVKPIDISIDLSKEISEDINAIFDNGDLYGSLDTKKIGKALSNKILKSLTDGVVENH